VNLPRLETERLVLRDHTEDDLPRMPRVYNDPDVSRFTRNIPHPYGDAEAKAAFKRFRRMIASGDALTFALELKETGDYIGSAVLILSHGSPAAELGYAVGREWWGKGYATEACAALLDFGFGVGGFETIHAHAMVDNPASSRVLEKLGMRSLGVLKNYCEKDGEQFDAAGFEITAAEWAAREQGAGA